MCSQRGSWVELFIGCRTMLGDLLSQGCSSGDGLDRLAALVLPWARKGLNI